MWRAAVAVLLGGCDVLFPLAAPDAPPTIDGSVEVRCDAINQTHALPLLADTYLDGTTAHGSESILELGPQVVLLRFGLGSLRVEDLSFTFVLTAADLADECGGPCGQCPQDNSAAGPNTQLIRPDWDEATATASDRALGMPWSATGPSGGDVGPSVSGTAIAMTGTTTIVFTIRAADLDPSWQPGVLSLMLADANTGAPHQFASRSNTCNSAPPPSLVARCLRVQP